ncbi:MAG: metal-dependent transcriptional regulator [Planctomycetes bacterium]|nr:metal-dependent transcriptional regulator [Planctomycetota bacterium]
MDKNTGQLSASLEDYLEAIFWIASIKGAARAKDIAKRLSVKAASVTGALRVLADKQFINYAPYELITLTPEGYDRAQQVIQKHAVLKDFFVEVLGIDAAQADEGACKLEHGLPDGIMERLLAFTEFVQFCPRCRDPWREQFLAHCVERKAPVCASCLKGCVDTFEKDQAADQVEEKSLWLSAMQPGRRCIVKRVRNKGALTRRLVEMGVSRGSVIEIDTPGPFGDPVRVKVKGCHLSLRLEEAACIEVQTL